MFTLIDNGLHELARWIVMGINGLLGYGFAAIGVDTQFLQSKGYLSAIDFFFYDTMKIFLLLCTIIFAVSYIRSYFPPERTRRILGEGKGRGMVGNVFAALLGIVTPFCSCSAVPLFIGFVEAGIPLGVTFSFLISSPMVNEVALIMLWGLFGWKIALLYTGTGVLIAILAGIIIGRLGLEKYVEEYVYAIKVGQLEEESPTQKQRLLNAKEYVKEILKKIYLYVVGGIFIGAVMHGWAPEGWLAQYAGPNNPFAVFIAVAIGVPLYSNAAGTIPIVKELTRLGMSMGTALAFMMSVTALSLPEIIILRRVLKPQLLAIFVGIMSVTIMIIGVLFNMVLSA